MGLDETQPIDATPEAGQSSGSWQRLITAFRGQQAVGRSVNLPSRYGGLVLQVPSLNNEKGKDATSDLKPRSKVNAKCGALCVLAVQREMYPWKKLV